MLKLVLVDPWEHGAGFSCRARNGPKKPMFIWLECDEFGIVIDSKENKDKVEAAFELPQFISLDANKNK